MSATFKCHVCGGTFEKRDDWTDQDAVEEYMELFGFSCNDLVSACDDCWEQIRPDRIAEPK